LHFDAKLCILDGPVPKVGKIGGNLTKETQMKVGMTLQLTSFGDKPDLETYQDELSLMEMSEVLGFDSVWALDHHFTGYVMSPDPTQLLSYVAGRTKRVQLGTAVIVLPWHDPVEIAEKIALLDVVSGGRTIFGFGRGVRRSVEGLRPRPLLESLFSVLVLRGIGRLLDFAMECVTAQGRIVFPDLELLGLELFVARGGVAGGRFAFLACFRAFDGNNFAGHNYSSVLQPTAGLFLLFGRLFFGLLFLLDFDGSGAVDSAELSEASLAKSAFAFQLRLRLDSEACPGDCGQAGLGDRFARKLANAVGIFFDSLQSLFDFVNGILVRREEA